MKNIFFKTTALAILGGSLFAASTLAIAGIANTKHNLGSAGTGDNKYSGTAEICVFCHTPHGSDTSATVPLWNKSLPAANTFTTYDTLGTTTLDGATANVGSVSVACLSCHDGAQAMDTVINQPGSGSVVASYGAGSWTGNSTPQGIAAIGKDLTNDHPVGIQYAGGGLISTDANDTTHSTFNDPDFKAAYKKEINTKPVWWVDTGGAGVREKTDMQLYSRPSTDVGGGATTEPFVECASCHDPHSENTTFLRISNNNSAVCLACHTK